MERKGAAMTRSDRFDGIAFRNMSDRYLVDCFVTLAERVAVNDDWIAEYTGCREELEARLSHAGAGKEQDK